jgi:hypothetical protein
MADPQIQQLLQAFGQLTGAAGNTRASLTGASQAMARLREQMQRGTGTVQSQTQALQSSIAQFGALQESVQKSAAGQQLLAQQAQAASEIFRNSAGAMSAALLKGGLTEAVSFVTKQMYTAIGSYQEGASGIQTAFNMQNAALESQISMLDKLTAGAEMAATTLALIPNPIARLTAGVAAGVGALAGFAKNLSVEQQKGLQALNKEVSITTMSFDVMTKNGVLLGGGMAQMRETAGELRLNLNEFSQVVTRSRKELVDFGGSAAGGVKKLRNVGLAFDQLSAEGKDLRRNLLLSGISYEEQTEGLAQFMDIMNKTGKLRGMTDKEIAEAGAKHLMTMKAVTAFTGEDLKAAQARAKEAAQQGAVRVKLEKLGGEATQKFMTLSAKMGPDMTKAMQQMLVTGGQVVDKNLNIMLNASPTRRRILDQVYADLQNGSITQAEASERYEQMLKDNAEAIKAEGDAAATLFGGIDVMGKGFSEQARFAESSQDLAARGLAARQAEVDGIGNTVQQMERLRTNMDKLGNVIDPLRESMIQAELITRTKIPEQINNLTGAMAMFVDKLGPKGLAGVMDEQFKLQEKYMKMYLGLVAEGPKVQTGGKVAEVGAKAGEVFLSVVSKLSDVVDKMDTVATRILKNLPGRATGSLGATGSIFEDFGPEGRLVRLHGVESVMTPKNVEDLLENAQAGVMKGLASTTSTDSATSAESAKMSETVTSTLSTLATQITNSNQAQISKLDELISTMRDKTIWEDMLRATEDTAENTRKMTNALA